VVGVPPGLLPPGTDFLLIHHSASVSASFWICVLRWEREGEDRKKERRTRGKSKCPLVQTQKQTNETTPRVMSGKLREGIP